MKTIEEIETAAAEAANEQPKGTKKAVVAKRARNVAPKKAKSGKIGHPCEESAQGREESHRRPGWQQDRYDPGNAEATRRSYRQGTAQSDGLAAAFPAGLHQRHAGQENGTGHHVHQGRGRRAQLLRQILIRTQRLSLRRRIQLRRLFLSLLRFQDS